MTRTEHLLTILAEECAEVAQRTSKALRFGLSEVQEGQRMTNADRIIEEMVDVLAVFDMLAQDGAVAPLTPDLVSLMKEQKRNKVEHFLRYSAKMGTL